MPLVGLNQLLRKVAIYLATQGVDRHIDYVGQALERGVPDVLQDHGAGHRTVYVAHQVFEQQEFFRAQIDGLAEPGGCSPDQIELQITGAQHAILILGVLTAAATKRFRWRSLADCWTNRLCSCLALVPTLILFEVSRATSMHVFLPRYQVVALPGVALLWALVASLMKSRTLRLLCCLVMVLVMTSLSFTTPSSRRHEQSWKAALAFVEKNASVDDAPVVICSGISESDHMMMPTGQALADSAVLTPLLYYKLTVPVVPLPRSLNEETVRVGSYFLAHQHERFLAMASEYSYPTLAWLAGHARRTDDVQELGVLDGVKILEFVPRAVPDASR